MDQGSEVTDVGQSQSVKRQETLHGHVADNIGRDEQRLLPTRTRSFCRAPILSHAPKIQHTHVPGPHLNSCPALISTHTYLVGQHGSLPVCRPRARHLSVPSPVLGRVVRLEHARLAFVGLRKSVPALLAHPLHLSDLADRLLELLHSAPQLATAKGNAYAGEVSNTYLGL